MSPAEVVTLTPPPPQSRARDTASAHGLLRGTLRGVGVLWVGVTLTFFALRVIPGDPIQVILGPGSQPTPERIAALQSQFGLDRPLLLQYVSYLGGLLHGDLGISYTLKQPVTGIIVEQLPSSIILTIASITVAWAMAVFSCLVSAGRSTLAERSGRAVEAVTASLPDFWLGLLLLGAFGFGLHWLPSSGGQGLAALVLPTLTIAIPLAGFLAQTMRQTFEETLDMPFVLAARARGVGELTVRARRVLRHAAAASLALTGWAVGWVISSSVAVEVIFARQGIGELLVRAVGSRDYPLVLGLVLVVAAIYVVITPLVDLGLRLLNPRLREQVA
ncbi:ABC transporter permease [Mycobacterium yunnanensis]|uniref:ABC transporter permease n=1 Tax=Mycobacterium yunnanensis TaxID=368477 RepID=A0A9X3C443_9MYCO|nr:ABC transporter permease [Mycobacterium yunnanensis]MCV7423996.1 ABC transporter permease [Mycobacterium yunnanensis]